MRKQVAHEFNLVVAPSPRTHSMEDRFHRALSPSNLITSNRGITQMVRGLFRNTLRILAAVTVAFAAQCAMAQTEAAAAAAPAATPASAPVSAPANTTASIPASVPASAQFDVADVHASPF